MCFMVLDSIGPHFRLVSQQIEGTNRKHIISIISDLNSCGWKMHSVFFVAASLCMCVCACVWAKRGSYRGQQYFRQKTNWNSWFIFTFAPYCNWDDFLHFHDFQKLGVCVQPAAFGEHAFWKMTPQKTWETENKFIFHKT
jgi:hypothetical protein